MYGPKIREQRQLRRTYLIALLDDGIALIHARPYTPQGICGSDPIKRQRLMNSLVSRCARRALTRALGTRVGLSELRSQRLLPGAPDGCLGGCGTCSGHSGTLPESQRNPQVSRSPLPTTLWSSGARWGSWPQWTTPTNTA